MMYVVGSMTDWDYHGLVVVVVVVVVGVIAFL